MYLHQLWHWCERVQDLGLYDYFFLYNIIFIFKEVIIFLTMVQLEDDEKTLVVQLKPKTMKVEPKNE